MRGTEKQKERTEERLVGEEGGGKIQVKNKTGGNKRERQRGIEKWQMSGILQ